MLANFSAMIKLTVHSLFKVFVIWCICQRTFCQGRTIGDCRTPDGQIGERIYVKNCKHIIDFLLRNSPVFSQDIANLINKYAQGFDGDEPLVCCPPKPIVISVKVRTLAPKSKPPNVSNHRNLRLLPEDCGYLDLVDKIRNGITALMNEFPWMALLSYQTGSGSEFRCGGTIINDRYILTAAHCLNGWNESLMSVRIGEYDISKNIDYEVQEDGTTKYNNPVQDLEVEEIIPYPGYNTSSLVNDIGLIRVSKMNLSMESARPVCLPTKSQGNKRMSYGVATGWGYTSNPDDGGKKSEKLQRVDLPVVGAKQCVSAYKNQPNILITKTQICAGGKNEEDTCFGDSGGPLQITDYVNNDVRYVQTGIVSYGPRYCGFGIPGVFTRVDYFMDWILDNLRQ